MTLPTRLALSGRRPPSTPRVPLLNLLPEELRACAVARRRGRVWLTSSAMLCALLVAAWSTMQQDQAERASLARMIEGERTRIAEEVSLAGAVAKDAQRAAKRQAQLVALQRQYGAAQQLAILSTALPDRTVLTGVTFATPRATPAKAPVAAKPAAPARSEQGPARKPAAENVVRDTPAAAPLEIHVTGYAADGMVLSQFVQGLTTRKSYQRVDLLRSASATVSGRAVVEFELVCRN